MFKSTPPAVFTVVLGLFGIGLAWRQLEESLSLKIELSGLLLGGTSLVFVVAVVSYVLKLIQRPSVLMDDFAALPGRAGLAALGGAGFLFAAAITPLAPKLAVYILLFFLAVHFFQAVILVLILWDKPLAARRMTPVWHLAFVGFIIAPVAAMPLGLNLLSEIILVLTIPMAVAIWAGHWVVLRTSPAKAPLRPTLMIHLSPLSLFGITFYGLGVTSMAIVFAVISLLAVLWALWKNAWLREGGFTPFWGAFTFPIAAFANVQLAAGMKGPGVFTVIGVVATLLGTLVILGISYRVIKMWTTGALAEKSNAGRV